MAIRPLIKYPDPQLRVVSEPVTEEPKALADLVQDMAETMFAAKGAGLAAIQVGVPLRLFIIDPAIAGGGEEDPPLVFINPALVELSREKETADEGCLSFPTIYVPVKRSLHARVRATNLQGEVFELEGSGLLARAFQHEYDHLDGKALADYVGRIKRQFIERKLARHQAEASED